MKVALKQAPVLAQLDFAYSFAVHTDASFVGLGTSLAQLIDSKEKVERECLAIVWTVEKWH